MIPALLRWWYADGWSLQWRQVSGRAGGAARFFSLNLLAGTLFQPYRQLSVGRVKGSAEVIIRAFFDRLISRAIGFMLRMVVIVTGLGVIIVLSVAGVAWAILWPLIPLAPIIGIVLAVMRVGIL